MSIFDPVKKAEAELDELLAEMNASAPALDAAGNPIVIAPAATGTPAADGQEVNTQTDGNPVVPETTNPRAQSDDSSTYWRERCEKVLGKYNSEVPRLSAEIANLKRQLTVAQSVQAQAAAPVVEGVDYKSPYVTDEMRGSRSYKSQAQEFGVTYAENQFEASVIASRSVTQSEIQPLIEREALSATDRLNNDISRLSPNWMTTNEDAAFINWAKATQEPYSGSTVINLLNNAYASGDAARVATIFNDYNQMLMSTTNDPAAGTPNVNALITPSKRGSAAQVNADTHQGKIWAEGEVDRFFDDYSKGRYENRKKEAKEIEAEIGRAYQEGRVR